MGCSCRTSKSCRPLKAQQQFLRNAPDTLGSQRSTSKTPWPPNIHISLEKLAVTGNFIDHHGIPKKDRNTKASYNPYSPHCSFQNPHTLAGNYLPFQELLDMRHLLQFKPKAISPPPCSVPMAVEFLTWAHCQCAASVKSELLQTGVTDLSQKSSKPLGAPHWALHSCPKSVSASPLQNWTLDTKFGPECCPKWE